MDEPAHIVIYNYTGLTDFYPAAVKNYTDQYREGGRFISGIFKGYTIAAYYHPTRNHTATANYLRVRKGPGEWAVAKVPKADYGNKTWYNVE